MRQFFIQIFVAIIRHRSFVTSRPTGRFFLPIFIKKHKSCCQSRHLAVFYFASGSTQLAA
ncbi:hypothetical protein COY34_01325 [candidate division WWE3 bacterium CG_4_10_14_0_2_um_filter_42_8]|uniref:Uncharacterized protein n=1 Tax=candidate division WWE3 bacterium CG_4_10_14_0_2_um_filter_42_8 TaxID=1975074 RepID=A0A2M7TCW8_UNCKA|nr:MAG: hypothetical protein COY34_01325 [candidate division WWE3 bacterium CG_4_10_14_0_2_um_filter_42_8]